jgi:hypothetical protein
MRMKDSLFGRKSQPHNPAPGAVQNAVLQSS